MSNKPYVKYSSVVQTQCFVPFISFTFFALFCAYAFKKTMRKLRKIQKNDLSMIKSVRFKNRYGKSMRLKSMRIWLKKPKNIKKAKK